MTEDEDSGSNDTPIPDHSPMRGMFQGTIVVLIGMVLVLVLDFLTKIVLARNLSISDFGVFGIAASLSNIVIIICLAGIGDGAASKIAKARTSGDNDVVTSLTGTSLGITLFLSLLGMAATFVVADFVAVIMDNPALSIALRVMSLTIPFLTIGRTLTGIKRGFKDYKAGTLFSDVSLLITRTLLFLVVVFTVVSLSSFLWAFAISAIVSTVLYILDSFRKNGPFNFNASTGKELGSFSFPLLAEPLLYAILSSAGAFFLGIFWDTENAGLYNAAHQFGVLVYFPIVGVMFLYLPIASELLAKKDKSQHQALYSSVTKWASYLASNVLILDLLYPQTLLSLIAPGYEVASVWLQLLALGYVLYVMFGPLSASVVAVGASRVVAAAWTVGTIINILLMLLLVPSYGGAGAALATGAGFIIVNLIQGIYLKSRIDLKLMYGKQHRIILLAVLLALPIWWLAPEPTGGYPIVMLPILLLIAVIISGIALLASRSITQDDLFLVNLVEGALGIQLGWMRRILSHFTSSSQVN